MEFYDGRDFLEEAKQETSNEKSEIQAFYANKTIFITGASGFLGTLILEKLLRTCKDLRKVYVLFRSSKRKPMKARLVEYFKDPVFDKMKAENPKYSTQVTCIEGDLSQDNLGMSPEDTQVIIDNTQVILHVAATVKFDERLTTAYNINVKGTKSLIHLAQQMRQLQVFVYVSTAFSNCDRKHIEEKFYDPVFTDEETMAILENTQAEEQTLLTPFVLAKKPNTYIFTKAISEDLVSKCSQHLPVVVVRPSIIMPTLKEPMSYWMKNMNTILSLMAGSGVGLIRVFYFGENIKVDLTPGDLTTNCVLAAGWQKAIAPQSPMLYNCVGYDNPVLLKDMVRQTYIKHKESEETIKKVVWRGHMVKAENTYYLFFLYYFLHVLPGLFFTLGEMYMNKKPMVMKIYRKFFFLNKTIHYFSFNEWSFTNDNTKALLNRLNPRDKELFNFNMTTFSWMDYCEILYRCVALYVINDYTEYPKELYRKQMKYINPIDKVIVWSFHFGALYLLFTVLRLCMLNLSMYFR
ncbi:hypothetical protein M8J76_011498 [Diaphorina citri]|nr:hypothetical protein M8J75_010062 [Diaphorina citri]KAI5749928.1 hypothetical protein M8J76_011498 [Diaphorina citri]